MPGAQDPIRIGGAEAVLSVTMGITPDYYTLEALRTLELGRWCREHNDILFFCEGRHESPLHDHA